MKPETNLIMSIIGIVAIDQNLAIGKGGKLPWHYSADMKFFKETTLGNAVVMGRVARSLTRHTFVIGGAKIYESFQPHIDKWIVTEIPLVVAGADTFMPANFLEGFEMYELRQLDDGLRVKFYEREGSLPNSRRSTMYPKHHAG